jgi:tetratricopeptide (TPR) repeat protein
MQPWESIRELRKAGKPDEAFQLAQGVLKESPDDYQSRTQAEWACFDLIKRVVASVQKSTAANERPDRADLVRLYELLRAYVALSPRKPDMAMSNILGQLSKVGRHFDRFLPFLKWAGLGSLRPEDLVPNEYQDKVYASLAVKLAREAAAWVKSRPEATDEQVELAVVLCKTAMSDAKDADKTWLEWSMAPLLRRTGNRRGAAELIVRVLKRKRTEFWAWAEAARIHREEQPELAIACFCQALRLGAEPKFLGRVHRELAELLAEAGEVAQATRETLIAVEIYDQEGWRHSPELEALLQAEWYDPAIPAAEPKEFYTLHADEALTLCFDEVREHQATYLGMTEAREGKKPRPRFSMRWSDGFISILGRRNARVLKTLQQGSPVELLLGIEGDRQDVLEILPRSHGKDWDCTAIKEGVIARLSTNGEGITVYCSREEEHRFPAKSWIGTTSPAPGIGARAWGATNPVNGHFEASRIEPVPVPENGDIRVFSGQLTRTTKGFGFVDEVFVPPPLVESSPPEARDVAVVAIMAFDKTKARHSWRAVAISACQ